LDIGVLGYIGIVWPKEHPPEVLHIPPGTPCIHTLFSHWGSWQHRTTSLEVTVKGFKKYCTSNVMDGTDDNTLWNGSEDNGNAESKCEEDEGIVCEDGKSDTDWW